MSNSKGSRSARKSEVRVSKLCRNKSRDKPTKSSRRKSFGTKSSLSAAAAFIATGWILYVQAFNNEPSSSPESNPFSPESLSRSQVLMFSMEGLPFCVGSIISPLVILTSAQCVFGLTPTTGLITVVAGLAGGSSAPQERRVSQIAYHQHSDPVLLKNDLALLILFKEFELNSEVRMVARSTRAELIPERGHALSSDWYISPRGVTTKIEKHPSACLPFRRNFSSSANLCSRVETFHPFGVFPGEPLFCASSYNPTQPLLCGISSSGRSLNSNKNNKTLPETLTIYTNLANHDNWIYKMVTRLGKSSQTHVMEAGVQLSSRGHYQKAHKVLKGFLSKYESSLGSTHIDVLTAKHVLTIILYKFEKYGEAFQLLEDVILARSELLGPTHVDTLLSQSELATHYFQRGDKSKALSLYRYVLRLQKLTLKKDSGASIRTTHNMAQVLYHMGHTNETMELVCSLLKVEKRKLGPLDAQTLGTKFFLAGIKSDIGDIQGALPMYQELSRDFEKSLGAHNDYTLEAKHALALTYLKLGNVTEAARLLPPVLQACTEQFGPSGKITRRVQKLIDLINERYVIA